MYDGRAGDHIDTFIYNIVASIISIKYNVIMSSAQPINVIRNENNYYAQSRSRKNVPNGQVMMLLACRLGMREFEYEKSRITLEGNTITLPVPINVPVETNVPIIVNPNMSSSD